MSQERTNQIAQLLDEEQAKAKAIRQLKSIAEFAAENVALKESIREIKEQLHQLEIVPDPKVYKAWRACWLALEKWS